jgi:RNA polymerase sigma-70 factor, ECF subfamily
VRRPNLRLRAMVAKHGEGVWKFLRSLGLPEWDADDALQEVVLVAARKLEEIRPGSEQAYLMSTAYKVALASRRARTRRTDDADAELETARDDRPLPDSMLEQKQARELLERVLGAMSLELRAVFVLYELDALTMSEISSLLELAPGTVASRLRRAREDFDERVSRLEKRLQHPRGVR